MKKELEILWLYLFKEIENLDNFKACSWISNLVQHSFGDDLLSRLLIFLMQGVNDNVW